MGRQLKVLAVFILILVLVATLAIFLSNTFMASQEVEDISPQYLTFHENLTKIYLVSATASYDTANETYNTNDGQIIKAGSRLFTLHLTLRNDYNIYDPPPPNVTPISPVDGTAYVYFNVQLYNKDETINATAFSISDFSMPSAAGTGLVLASGQTASVNIYMSTNQSSINRCKINLVYVGDSIPI